jgi:hypothetical protein
MCFYTDKICNQQPFHISFPKFLWEGKYDVLNWWKKNAALKHTNHFVFKFFQRDFSTSTSVVFYIFLVRDLRCPQWWGFIILRTRYSRWSVLYKLLHSFEFSGGRIWIYLHSLPEDKGTVSGCKTSVPMHVITQSHDLED